MRSLIFSFITFTAIVAGAYFLFADNQSKPHAAFVHQTVLPVANGSQKIPAVHALNGLMPITKGVELLTEGEWKIQSIISNKPCDTNYDGRFTIDISSEMPACALDDVVKFDGDGIVAFQRHERCELTEEDVEKYNWYYSEQENKLYIARGSVEAMMILRSLSENEFVVDIPMQDGGESHVFTVTYGRPAYAYSSVDL